MKTISKTAAAIAIAAFMGCEGNTRQAYYLENETGDWVTVIHAHSVYIDGMDLDTVSVAAGVRQELGVENWLGGREQPDLPSAFIDTILVYNAAGQLCTKNWLLMSEWEIESIEDRKVPAQWSHEYTFHVSEGDF